MKIPVYITLSPGDSLINMHLDEPKKEVQHCACGAKETNFRWRSTDFLGCTTGGVPISKAMLKELGVTVTEEVPVILYLGDADIETQIQERVKAVVEQEWAPKVKDLQNALTSQTDALHGRIKKAELVQAINAEGGTVEKLYPTLEQHIGVDDSGNTFVKNEKGEVKMRELNPTTGEPVPFSINDLVKEFKENPLWTDEEE